MFEISGRGNQKTLLFDRHHSSTRSQAPAWERTLWKLCFLDPAFDRHTPSILRTDVMVRQCLQGVEAELRGLSFPS